MAPTPDPPSARDAAELERLAAEARYHRDRLRLYRARVIGGGSSPTSPGKLARLEQASAAADERLAHVQRSRRANR